LDGNRSRDWSNDNLFGLLRFDKSISVVGLSLRLGLHNLDWLLDEKRSLVGVSSCRNRSGFLLLSLLGLGSLDQRVD